MLTGMAIISNWKMFNKLFVLRVQIGLELDTLVAETEVLEASFGLVNSATVRTDISSFPVELQGIHFSQSTQW